MAEWQPISTAPYNEFIYVVWDGQKAVGVKSRHKMPDMAFDSWSIGTLNAEGKSISLPINHGIDPTKWMPLLEPPKEQETN